MRQSTSNIALTPVQRRILLGGKFSIANWALCAVIVGIILVSLGLFVEFVNPSLKGANGLRFGADSDYYLWHAGLRQDLPAGYSGRIDADLLSIGGNLLAPELIARSLRSNALILCFNYIIFVVSVCLFTAAGQVQRILLAFLLLANPSVVISLLTLNKEILALFSTALLCKYLAVDRRSRLLLLLLLIASFLARWENFAVVVFFLAITSRMNPVRQWRKVELVILLAVLSALYPLVPFIELTFGDDSVQGTTVGLLSSVQSHFLYFAVALPKICLNLFGAAGIFILHGRTAEDRNNIYDSIVVPWSSLANLTVAIWFAFRRRMGLSNDLFFFAVVYVTIFAVAPFVQYRYFLPQYYILCVGLAIPKSPRESAIMHEARV